MWCDATPHDTGMMIHAGLSFEEALVKNKKRMADNYEIMSHKIMLMTIYFFEISIILFQTLIIHIKLS